VLKIVSPSTEHDGVSRVIAALIELMAEEADAAVFYAGMRREMREQGG